MADARYLLAEARAAFGAMRYEEALAAAAPYLDAEDRELRIRALTLFADSLCWLDRIAEAVPLWRRLSALEATVESATRLMIGAALTGDFDGAEEALQEIGERLFRDNEAGKVRDPSTLARLYATLIDLLHRGGASARAVRYLLVMKGWYTDSGITDARHLSMRGLPGFAEFLDSSYPIVKAGLGPQELAEWWQDFAAAMDEEGRAMLEERKAAYLP